MNTDPKVVWPEGRSFAFTVFDDTDNATVENVGPVYALLRDLGLWTTKSVWAMPPIVPPRIGGATCDDAKYRNWTLELQSEGFEIGSHGASPATSPRDLVVASFERFREIYGHDPASFANHSGCKESIYWGEGRVSGPARVAYNAMTGFGRRGMFRGHVEGDELFWGDVCRDRVRYVRNFTYRGINTLAACPQMPYHDLDRSYVNAWFASSEGASLPAFNRCLDEREQDRLEAEGGACIMYTHFASGFVRDGELDPRFEQLMRRLARKNGWFVPTATLLDHLAAQRGKVAAITAGERRSLEYRWLASKARIGYS